MGQQETCLTCHCLPKRKDLREDCTPFCCLRGFLFGASDIVASIGVSATPGPFSSVDAGAIDASWVLSSTGSVSCANYKSKHLPIHVEICEVYIHYNRSYPK